MSFSDRVVSHLVVFKSSLLYSSPKICPNMAHHVYADQIIRSGCTTEGFHGELCAGKTRRSGFIVQGLRGEPCTGKMTGSACTPQGFHRAGQRSCRVALGRGVAKDAGPAKGVCRYALGSGFMECIAPGKQAAGMHGATVLWSTLRQ